MGGSREDSCLTGEAVVKGKACLHWEIRRHRGRRWAWQVLRGGAGCGTHPILNSVSERQGSCSVKGPPAHPLLSLAALEGALLRLQSTSPGCLGGKVGSQFWGLPPSWGGWET